MDNKTITIVALSVTLAILIGCIGSSMYLEMLETRAYNRGVNDSIRYLNAGILNELRSNGFITVNYPIENRTVPIKLVPYTGGQK